MLKEGGCCRTEALLEIKTCSSALQVSISHNKHRNRCLFRGRGRGFSTGNTRSDTQTQIVQMAKKEAQLRHNTKILLLLPVGEQEQYCHAIPSYPSVLCCLGGTECSFCLRTTVNEGKTQSIAAQAEEANGLPEEKLALWLFQ